MKYEEAGTYHLEYKAVDECGNETIQTRYIEVKALRTVLYNDGTFIINEKSSDIEENTRLHGSADYIYPPLDVDNDYVFTATRTTLWVTEEPLIKDVKFGSEVAPTSLAFWFDHCENMVSIDWTNFDGSNVTSARSFLAHTSLTSVTFPPMPNLEDIAYIINECLALRVADFSQVGSDKIKDMNASFSWAKNLVILDLSGLSGSIQIAKNAFAAHWQSTEPMALTTIYVNSNLDFSEATDSSNMFRRCNNLVGGKGTVWNSNYIDKTYARIDNPPDEPGYFTLKQ